MKISRINAPRQHCYHQASFLCLRRPLAIFSVLNTSNYNIILLLQAANQGELEKLK